MSNKSGLVPVATYRIQLGEQFNFDAAAGITEYLRDLGISHLYASPYLQTAPGVDNAYAVANFSKVCDQLGGSEGHARLNHALAQHGLRQVLDIVPNHMAVGTPENRWWWDVLEHGQRSRYACYFDIDWQAPEARLHGKVILPILSDQFGRIIEAGKIRLDRTGAHFTLHYLLNAFPVSPASLSLILNDAAKECSSEILTYIAEALDQPTTHTADDEAGREARRERVLLGQLSWLLNSDKAVAEAVDSAVARVNAEPDLLEALLRRQHYRLACWRAGIHELNYRRFFNIDTLIGLCIESEEVFNDTHQLVLDWVHSGLVDGLRVDHIDGLREPEQYLRRLRQAAPTNWIIVEKILIHPERLPESWPVAGTTGYDFLNRVAGLFLDPKGEEPLTRFYEEFTHESSDFSTWLRDKKDFILNTTFGGELNRLTHIFVEICERQRQYRDYTRYELREALRQFIVCLPVYRAYARPETGAVSAQDVIVIESAIDAAKTMHPEIDARLLDFLQDILLLRVRGENEDSLVVRVQQLTGPVMAKGTEDTAFYCYNRLISLNEVGGSPDNFGWSPDEFHQSCMEMQERWPEGMTTTATHDTKRGEDVRLRIGMLSERPAEWIERVRRWSEMNEQYRTDNLPERNAEYLFYQTLAGAWPLDIDRAVAFMAKAAREAKTYTSWIDPDPIYDAALRKFVTGVLSDAAFLEDLQNFLAPMREAAQITGLSQVLIKMTAPGVPDTYQGCELWDLNLVDPDNRRPVDYELRRRLLVELAHLSAEEIWARRDSGMPKLYVLRQALRVRREVPEAFAATGSYVPISCTGEKNNHVLAFSRGGRVITLVPRLVFGLGSNWGDTQMSVPPGQWHNELTGEEITGGEVTISGLLRRFPAALLNKRGN